MMKEVCYAYCDKRCSEELWQHLEEVSICIRKSHLCERIVRKISWLMNGSDMVMLSELLSIAGLLHDIGKAFDEFQNRDELTRFPGHDIVSASIAVYGVYMTFNDVAKSYDDLFKYLIIDHRSLDTTDERDIWLYMNLVVLPILLHHYAQHGYSYWSSDKWRGYLGGTYKFNKCGYIAQRLKASIHNYRSHLVRRYLEKVVELLEDSRDGIRFVLEELFEQIIQYVRSRNNVHPNKYLILAITGLLNLCDGRVSMIRRRCKLQ